MSQLDIREPFQFFDWFGLSEAAEKASSDLSYHKRFDRVLKAICRVAPTKIPVLLKGGSGTEYEALARVLHMHSHRRGAGFVQVDCRAKAAPDLETELIGVIGGANGKPGTRHGDLEAAHMGTLLLKHVEFLPALVQERILGLLQEDGFPPNGGKPAQGPNIRLVVASRQDLKCWVEAEKFNIDLYRRLSVFPIELPSCG